MTAQSRQRSPFLHLVVTPELLSVTHRDEGAVWVMTLVGEADLGTRDELELGLAYALSQHRKALVVDVSALDFCDSRCATTLIEANCNAPGTEMVLLGSNGIVNRVFDLLDPGWTLARHR
jgi:anti-anti-sigma factor